MMRQAADGGAEILNSWKEIAAFLDRGVRTVQRWERELQLPVHRIGKGNRAPVFANVAELRFWMSTSGYNRQEAVMPAPKSSPPSRNKAIENSRRLMTVANKLSHQLAENSVRQRRQAEQLQARILEMRSRMK
jgi:hypothetical protein